MDINFENIKQQNISNAPTEGKMSTQYLLDDLQLKANEGSSAEVKNHDIKQIDTQAFVQHITGDATEAQEQLNAKFLQTKDDFNDFLGQTTRNVTQGVSSITHDFMNAERGSFSSNNNNKHVEKIDNGKTANLLNEHNLLNSGFPDVGNNNITMSGNIYNKNLMDDMNNVADIDPIMPVSNQKLTKMANKDSDTDLSSISYNPSPAKQFPKTDALKEQDNEHFISSEDLLSTLDQRNIKSISAKQKEHQHSKGTPIIDLDADDDNDFVQAEIPKFSEESIQLNKQANTVASIIKPIPTVTEFTETKPNISIDMKTNKTNVTTVPIMSEITSSIPINSRAPEPKSVLKSNTPNINPHNTQIISVEDIFYKYGFDAWFKPERLHPQVESLIYWRDVKKSGVVFGAGLITLLAISCFSVISVFAYLSLTVLSSTIAFRIYKCVMQAIQKTSDGHPFKEYLEYDLTLSQEKVQHIAGIAVAHINGFISEMRRLFLVEDLVDSIKFGVILCVMTYIGAWFNGMTLVLMAFVSLFTLPKVYENNKQSIDTYLDLARSKVAEVTEKIKAAIPLGTKRPLATVETDKDK